MIERVNQISFAQQQNSINKKKSLKKEENLNQRNTSFVGEKTPEEKEHIKNEVLKGVGYVSGTLLVGALTLFGLKKGGVINFSKASSKAADLNASGQTPDETNEMLGLIRSMFVKKHEYKGQKKYTYQDARFSETDKSDMKDKKEAISNLYGTLDEKIRNKEDKNVLAEHHYQKRSKSLFDNAFSDVKNTLLAELKPGYNAQENAKLRSEYLTALNLAVAEDGNVKEVDLANGTVKALINDGTDKEYNLKYSTRVIFDDNKLGAKDIFSYYDENNIKHYVLFNQDEFDENGQVLGQFEPVELSDSLYDTVTQKIDLAGNSFKIYSRMDNDKVEHTPNIDDLVTILHFDENPDLNAEVLKSNARNQLEHSREFLEQIKNTKAQEFESEDQNRDFFTKTIVGESVPVKNGDLHEPSGDVLGDLGETNAPF